MDYLAYDIHSFQTQFKNLYESSTVTARNTGSMASSLNHLQSMMERGFEGVQLELFEVSRQLDDMLEVMIDFRNTQFIQNEQRNQYLASIDATLKAPNKTAALEKYEISLELASKNKPGTAIKFLKEAIELNPLHYRSYVQLTLNLWKIKNYPEAVHYAQESLNFAPDHPEVLAYSYSLVAQAYEKVNDYPAALHAVNQALHHSHQSDYTYAKARYYALLQDVASAMSELKKTIELNPMYFAISLMDSAFHPYHQEREKLLTSLKTALESKLNQAISQMEAVQFHRYTHSKWSEGELEYNGFDNSIIDYRYKHLHPDFKQYRFVYVGGVEGKRIPYSYNRLVGEFHEHYTQLYELYMKKLPVIKQFKSLNTYVDFTTSYKEFTLFQTEFNRLVVGLTALVNRFKEKSATTQQIFKENLDLALEISAAMKKRLKQEKGKKVFNLLGVVGAILLPMKIQHDHMAESCLEKLYQRVKKVTAEARRNVELEGKHTLAIQRFAEEVLIQKPLPNIL